jgi:hypothetical protein
MDQIEWQRKVIREEYLDEGDAVVYQNKIQRTWHRKGPEYLGSEQAGISGKDARIQD